MPSPRRVKSEQGSSGWIPPDDVLFGCSTAMASVRKRVDKICGTNVPVLLWGDAGTGKEVLARWMHTHSPFSCARFVKVNCAAIPSSLLESELFGYEKGAFTGAHNAKPGRVEQAHEGTLFLDEIAELDLTLQSKLLHFMQDGSFCPIGGESEKSVNARIICATNRDLAHEIAEGRFRADLYYRISVFEIKLPRLQERQEDVPALAQYFRILYQRQFVKECEPLGSEILNYLENLHWPGNVRELSNCIARYVLIGNDAFVEQNAPEKRKFSSTDGPRNAANLPLKSIAKEAIREVERNVILETLRTNQWNRRRTAQALKISYRALIYKIRDAGLISRRASVVKTQSGGTELAGSSLGD